MLTLSLKWRTDNFDIQSNSPLLNIEVASEVFNNNVQIIVGESQQIQIADIYTFCCSVDTDFTEYIPCYEICCSHA